ncbi:hypothetical protein G6F60_001111 [Rhizopus arrhizus]|nr:hypothetical protein G6F60_001111 [Rhizopus arrhizus]
MYPIENMINFDICRDLKSSEKEAKERKDSSAEKPQKDDKKDACKHYKDGWISKNNKDPQEYIQRSSGSGRLIGRPPVLTDEHKNYVIQWADEHTDSVVLEDMLDVLTEKFEYLQITKSGLYKCEPKTGAKTTTTSPFDVVNMSVRHPRALAPSKKRKATGGTKEKESNDSGTVIGHYFNFISSVLDVMDRHKQFRGHYLIMDDALIHKHEDIQKHIESRGYGCLYLPPYSPELNPIEQFWSICKSKLKKEQLLDEETRTTRITDACN